MRDGTRQPGNRRQADAAEAFDWVDVDVPQSRPRTPGQLRPADGEPDATERITLIEFTWFGLTGAQPVILVSREWLQ